MYLSTIFCVHLTFLCWMEIFMSQSKCTRKKNWKESLRRVNFGNHGFSLCWVFGKNNGKITSHNRYFVMCLQGICVQEVCTYNAVADVFCWDHDKQKFFKRVEYVPEICDFECIFMLKIGGKKAHFFRGVARIFLQEGGAS